MHNISDDIKNDANDNSIVFNFFVKHDWAVLQSGWNHANQARYIPNAGDPEFWCKLYGPISGLNNMNLGPSTTRVEHATRPFGLAADISNLIWLLIWNCIGATNI